MLEKVNPRSWMIFNNVGKWSYVAPAAGLAEIHPEGMRQVLNGDRPFE